MVQWLRLCAPNARDLDSIPGQGTRSHLLQLRILPVVTETHVSQIYIYIYLYLYLYLYSYLYLYLYLKAAA